MSRSPAMSGDTRLRQERDLYLRLLNLGTQNELSPFLEEALALVVEISGAQRGYLELRGEAADGDDPVWWISHELSSEEVEGIRTAVSRGIIAEALATGETVETGSALLDPRFRERGSVQMGRIQAVLCAPVGGDASLGVVYLQGRLERGPFSQDDTERVETFARHLAPLADRLIVKERVACDADPTAVYRKQLRLDGVIGRSRALSQVFRQAALVAPLEVGVLLTGASGTGKTQLARVIHDNGPRASHPFVEVNCAALPETLIESELFGSRAGAHSAAQKSVHGKVAAAERGTLLLDEIGELPVDAQAKLLHLLQSKQYYPLGASAPVHADVRLIAATNAVLTDLVEAGRFREDLFYRLHVLPIRMPSLSEREEDIPQLAEFFVREACARHGLPAVELSLGALHAVAVSEWPGNLRELGHSLEAAAIRAAGEGAASVERHHVFPDDAPDPENAGAPPLTFQSATRRFQRDLLQQSLQETGWNVAETARRLDVARSHVYNLIKAFQLERDATS